jgi:hypothetical protein
MTVTHQFSPHRSLVEDLIARVRHLRVRSRGCGWPVVLPWSSVVAGSRWLTFHGPGTARSAVASATPVRTRDQCSISTIGCVSDEVASDENESARLPTVVLDLPSARDLAGHLAVYRDLIFVQECCERLLQLNDGGEVEPDPVLVDALWSMAVIAYARCFKDGRREYRPQLSEVAALPLEGEFVEFHEFILKLRDKHIAHSVNPFEQVLVGVVLSRPEDPERKVEGVATLAARHFVADNVGVGQLGHLAHTLAIVVAQKAENYTASVLADAEALDIDELYALPPLRFVAPGVDSAARPRP